MYRNILVPIDGSDFSNAAVTEAAKLAKALGSKLVLFFAVPYYYYPLPAAAGGEFPASHIPVETGPQQPTKAMEAEAKTMLASAAGNSNLAGLAVERRFAVSNSPYEAIIEAARKFRCELIVMGSHGRSGLSGVLLGSQTQKVLTHSTVPVLVVR